MKPSVPMTKAPRAMESSGSTRIRSRERERGGLETFPTSRIGCQPPARIASAAEPVHHVFVMSMTKRYRASFSTTFLQASSIPDIEILVISGRMP